jgi:Uncharacterized membrane-associated protein
MLVSLDRVLTLIQAYAPLFVFGWMVLENTLFLGVLVPGLTVLVVTGLLLHTGDVPPGPVLAAALGGTYLGDNLNYALGRWGLPRLRWIRRILSENDDARRFIDQSPVGLYVFFHFPVYLRSAFPLTLGALRYPWRRWLLIDAAAAPVFVAAFVGLGYGLGRYVLPTDDLAAAVRDLSVIGNGIILLFSLAFAYGTCQFVRTVWNAASARK